MIKKILLYVVFAIPSLFFGLFAYFYNGADARSSIAGAIAFLVMTYLILAWAMGDLKSGKAQTTYNIEPLSIDYLPEDEFQSVELISVQIISKRIDGCRMTFRGTDEELAKLQHCMLKDPLYVYDDWLWSTEDDKPTLTATCYAKHGV